MITSQPSREMQRVSEEIEEFLGRKIEELVGKDFRFVLAIEYPNEEMKSCLALYHDKSPVEALSTVEFTANTLRKIIASEASVSKLKM